MQQGTLNFETPSDGQVSDQDKRQLTSIETLLAFMFAGNATLTIRSVKTQQRFTYRVKKPPPPEEGKKAGPVSHFVAVLTGPENSHDYTYLGHIFQESRDFVHGRKSHIGINAPSAIAWQWFYGSIVLGNHLRPEKVEIWHEGRCGRCNRRLTVPESIDSGIGPDCAKYLGVKGKTND